MSPPVRRIEGDRELPEAADVVVIGGGIVGSAAAYFLAKKRLRVVLLEKGHVAGEQSSRNWGWCRVQGKPLAELPLAQLSSSTWDGLTWGGSSSSAIYGVIAVFLDCESEA